MGDLHELIEAPLSREELAARYRALCDDPEVWIVFPQSKRIEFHGKEGLVLRSHYAIDLADIFG
jgi:hypothetical protein